MKWPARTTLSAFALVLAGLWGASQAMANSSICDAISGNVVANCGFESGDFTSWTLFGNTTNPGGNYFGVDAADANSGNFGAYLGTDPISGGPLGLGQLLTTKPGQSYLLSFWLQQDAPSSPGYDHVFVAAVNGVLWLGLTDPGQAGSWRKYSDSFVAVSTSTVMEFALINDDSFWSLDDVSVTPTPDPGTFLLLGSGLAGLVGFLRRKVS